MRTIDKHIWMLGKTGESRRKRKRAREGVRRRVRGEEVIGE